jgi:hypothetical protein
VTSFEDFVPDVARVRGLLGPGSRAADLERFVLLGVSGKVIVRTSWTDDAELSRHVFEKLKNKSAPPGDIDAESPVEHAELDPGSRSAPFSPCTMCAVTPGKVFCGACGGSGKVHSGDELAMDCPACKEGKIVCPTCEGSCSTAKVKVLHCRDQPSLFARAFVPEAADNMRAPLAEFLRTQPNIPACLNVDLDDEFDSRDAYRGRRSQFEYKNHQMGGALTLARRYVERVTRLPSVLRARHVACAWPFVVCREKGRFLAMVDARGVTRLVASAPE